MGKVIQFRTRKVSQPAKRFPHPFDLCHVTDINIVLEQLWPKTTAAKLQSFNPDF